MRELVGIVNYGTAGNIHSVNKAIERSGGEVILINSPEDFKRVSRVVLPGVGSFKHAMEELKNDGFVEPLKSFEGPILGICLGMQILGSIGYEHGCTAGLNFIKAEAKPMECSGKVPHVGFNSISLMKNSSLFKGIENKSFYFMHSFEVVNYTEILALTDYAGHSFVSAVHAGNIFGVQFHPEKSREAGLNLFRNFLQIEKV